MMPEMTGATCVNGVSWRLYETPMVLLDARSAACFGVDRRGKNIRALELVTYVVRTTLLAMFELSNLQYAGVYLCGAHHRRA